MLDEVTPVGAGEDAGVRGAPAEAAAEVVDEIKVEDAGLQQLAQRIQAEALGLQEEEGGSAAPLPVEDCELDQLNVRSLDMLLNPSTGLCSSSCTDIWLTFTSNLACMCSRQVITPLSICQGALRSISNA